MRLVCPNCSAQYEVPGNVIPEGGRDVQCSNCGHTWFQRHPDDDPGLAQELGAPVPNEQWEPEVGAADTAEAAPETDTPAPKRRELDPSVTEILREEAEREVRARAAQADPLESQPELGLEPSVEDEEERRTRQSRERMARMRGEEPEAETAAASAAAAAASSRRDLLPDIDEINSTLRAASERKTQDQQNDELSDPLGHESARTGRFNRGFLMGVFLIAALLVIYVTAPTLKQTVPSAAGAIDAYVGFIDGLRSGLNSLVANLLGTLGGLGQDAASQ